MKCVICFKKGARIVAIGGGIHKHCMTDRQRREHNIMMPTGLIPGSRNPYRKILPR